MSFISYKPFKKRNLLPKYLIVFLLGISSVLFFTNAFTIVTGIDNAVQYIKQIVLTSDGTASGTTGIVLNGSGPFKLQVYGDTYLSGGLSGNNVSFTTGQFSQRIQSSNYCNFAGTLCKTFDDLYIWNKNGNMIYYNTGNVGIGTTTPTYPLEVNGDTKINGEGSFGFLKIGGSSLIYGPPSSSYLFTASGSTVNINGDTILSGDLFVRSGLLKTSGDKIFIGYAGRSPELNIDGGLNVVGLSTLGSVDADTLNTGTGAFTSSLKIPTKTLSAGDHPCPTLGAIMYENNGGSICFCNGQYRKKIKDESVSCGSNTG